MNPLNHYQVEGNITKDPELKQPRGGRTVCNFTMSSSRYYNGSTGSEKEVSYLDVEVWGRLGESVYAQGRKGRGIRVVGRLRQDRWQGDDGKNHSRLIIVAEHIEYKPGLAELSTEDPVDFVEAEVPPDEEEIEESLEVSA